jgi:hypothetical protein
MGAELFHADIQTDMMNLIVAFRNFANSPKNGAKFIKIVPQYSKTSITTETITGVCRQSGQFYE